jgi:hypothetical protein
LNIESEAFEKKWIKMYNYRNAIAHNRFINKNEYSEAKVLCEDLKNILNEALKNISNIVVEDKEIINITKLNNNIDDYFKLNIKNFISQPIISHKLDIGFKENNKYLKEMSDSIKLKSIIYPYESITEMNDKLRESL